MRTARIVALVALLSGGIAYGQTKVVYTLELDGNNHADLWEQNQTPTFTAGVTSGAVTAGTNVSKPDLTWAVRVTVGGKQTGDAAAPGYDKYPLGAANLVFDLELRDSLDNLVAVGAATVVNGTATDGGFWSSINDGDSVGRPSPDILANAAFAISLWNSDVEPTQKTRLIDPAPTGPNFDYGWYPTANGRSGVDTAGTKTVTAVACDNGKLLGFGAGMKSYDYTSYRPGVGKLYPSWDTPADVFGFGAYLDDTATDGNEDPMNPLLVTERALFEGQLSVRGLANGTYTLKVIPSVDGNNVIQGHVTWNSDVPNFGGFGSFAVKAQEVAVTNGGTMTFVVDNIPDVPPTSVAARKVFYNNSYYDNNNAAIQTPGPGARDDDSDAIDTTKSPLMVTGTPAAATFANYTGYNKGLNGLIYDIQDPTRDPVAADFTFVNAGKNGAASPGTVISPLLFAVQDRGNGLKRVVITFVDGNPNLTVTQAQPAGSVVNTWLQVTIGTGFGLTASETHYWGNVAGDGGVGNTATNLTVTTNDELGARGNPHTSLNRAPVSDEYDYNKNSTVDTNDQLYVRSHTTTSLNCVKVITK